MKTLNKKLVKQISKMLLVLLAFNLVATTGIKASAATNAAITYEVTGELKKGTTIKIALNVKDATNLYGASWDMAYDQTLLKIKSIAPGNVFPENASKPVIETANGKVEYVLTLTGNAKPAATSGTIAIIEAEVLKDGKMTLKTSPSNNALSATGVNCRVKLANTPGSTVNADIPYTATDKVIGGGTPVVEVSTITSLTSNKATGVTVGTPITFTATATPADKTLYEFYIKEGTGAWVKKQVYSNKNTFVWTPSKSGEYQVSAYVKHVNSTKNVDTLKTLKFTVTDAQSVVVNSITANKPSPAAPNTQITFTANATGSSSILYQYWVNDGSGWKMVRDYSTSKTFVWTPSKIGNYQISAYAKASNSANKVDSLKVINYKIESATNAVTVNSVTSSKPSPSTVNTPITFTANATGGSSILYQYWVNDGSGWKMARDYSTSKTFIWTPSKSGKYQISVYAKDSKSTNKVDSLKVIDYTIK